MTDYAARLAELSGADVGTTRRWLRELRDQDGVALKPVAKVGRGMPQERRSSGHTRPSSTGPDSRTRDIVRVRCEGKCERCGVHWNQRPLQQHHRRPRAMGGTSDPATNSPANLLSLCDQCHAWVESERLTALRFGYLVNQGHDPAQVPVLVRPAAIGWVLLTHEGNYQPIPGEHPATEEA